MEFKETKIEIKTETKKVSKESEFPGYIRSPTGWIPDPKVELVTKKNYENAKASLEILQKILKDQKEFESKNKVLYKVPDKIPDKIPETIDRESDKILSALKQENAKIIKMTTDMQLQMHHEYPEELKKCKNEQEKDVVIEEYIYTLNWTIQQLCDYLAKQCQ